MQNNNEQRIGFTLPTEIGKEINDITSPDITNNRKDSTADLFNADFKCNISDLDTLKTLFKLKIKNVNRFVPVLYFTCKKRTLSLKRMVDYINSTCKSILPFKLKESDFEYFGVVGVQHIDLFISFLPDDFFEVKKKEREINKFFIDSLKEKYKKCGLLIKFGTKESIQKFLKRIPNINSVIKDEKIYIFIFSIENMLSKNEQLNILNKIDFEVDVFGNRNISKDDLIDVGQFKIETKTNSNFNIVVSAVEV